MKRTLLSLLVLATFCPVARATPQVGDPLKINGTNHYVHGFYLRKDMEERFEANRDKLVVIRSSNWGGSNVTLEVRDKKLYLTSLDIDRPGWPWPFNGPSVRTMFGVTIPKEGLFADWFTDELEEGIGAEIVFYTGITKESRFFVFEKGILKKAEIRESSGSKMMKELETRLESSTNTHEMK